MSPSPKRISFPVCGILGWQGSIIEADGTCHRLRSRPWIVSQDAYNRAARAMRAIAARRGPAGLGVDEDRDARLWRAWNEAAMRQCRLLIPSRR